jgi:O-antigen/teichoic acid export membrane protein
VLLRSFSTLAVGEVVARLAGLVAVLLLARRLGPVGFGIVTLGLTLIGWFGLVVDSGTELLNVRNIAREPERFGEIASRVLGLRLVLALGAMAVFMAGVELFTRSHAVRSVLVLFGFALPALALNLRWMVLGIHRARAIAIGIVAGRLVMLLGALVLVHDFHDIRRVPFLEVGAEMVYGAAILIAVARRFGFVVPKVDLASWWTTLRDGAPLMVNSVARASSYSFDVIVIELVLGPHDLGLFGAGSKPVLFVTSLFGLFSVAFLSSVSSVQREAADALFRRAVRTVLGVSAALAVVMSTTAVVLIPLVFGHPYRSAGIVLAILAWRIPFGALGTPYVSMLIARNWQVVAMRNNLVAAGITIGGDLFAIPVFGLTGAACVGVVSALVSAFLNQRSCVRGGLAPSPVAVLAGRPTSHRRVAGPPPSG